MPCFQFLKKAMMQSVILRINNIMSSQASPSLPFLQEKFLLALSGFITLAVPFLLILGRGFGGGAMGLVSVLFICRSALFNKWECVKPPWLRRAEVVCTYMLN